MALEGLPVRMLFPTINLEDRRCGLTAETDVILLEDPAEIKGLPCTS